MRCHFFSPDGSKFRFDDSGMSNGHAGEYQEDPYSSGSFMGEFPDPELRLLQKQKLLLETENLKQQLKEFKEKAAREKERCRLETLKVKHELLVLKLKAREVKARTDYFVAAKKSILEKEGREGGIGNSEPQKNGPKARGEIHHNPLD